MLNLENHPAPTGRGEQSVNTGSAVLVVRRKRGVTDEAGYASG